MATALVMAFMGGWQWRDSDFRTYKLTIEKESLRAEKEAAERVEKASAENIKENERLNYEWNKKMAKVVDERDSYNRVLERLRKQSNGDSGGVPTCTDPAFVHKDRIREAVRRFAEEAGAIAQDADRCIGTLGLVK